MGKHSSADWSAEIVPGQDLGIRLQAFLGWLNNYGHLSYEKQQELLWELGKIAGRTHLNFMLTEYGILENNS